MRILQHIGEYMLLMGKVLRKPDRWRMFWRQYSRELEKQGLQSLPIVLIISVFIGAILTIQAKTNTENPFMPYIGWQSGQQYCVGDRYYAYHRADRRHGDYGCE